jgi:hypothetical protein
MDINESIIELGSKLDAWLDGNLRTISSMDRLAQFKALLAGIEITKELDQIKAQGLTAIATLLKRPDAATENERAASLVRGFEFAARLSDTLSDELMDIDGHNKVVLLMNGIANTLGAMACGRAPLAILLDHPDAGIRASAGAYLIDLMPECVLPILHEIEEKEHGNSAHSTAHNAILGWECEGKHKKPERPM